MSKMCLVLSRRLKVLNSLFFTNSNDKGEQQFLNSFIQNSSPTWYYKETRKTQTSKAGLLFGLTFREKIKNYSIISFSTMSPTFSSDEEVGSVVGEITPEGGLVICSVCVGTIVVEGISAGFSLATSPVYAVVNRPTFSVKIRRDRRAINVYFYNQKYTKSITYELTYTGNGLDQGVVGSIYKNEGNSAFRLLLFGTCSKNVCTYHRNIQNAQLTIRAKLLTGQTLIKRYHIKI